MPRDAHQDMIDNAKLFCRAAVRAIQQENWKAAAGALLDRCRELDMALQSLTPGGSEYVGDPERCVLVARKNLQNLRDKWMELVRKDAPPRGQHDT